MDPNDRTPELTPDEVEELLRGTISTSDRAALHAVARALDAAREPGRPEELGAMDTNVAAFHAALEPRAAHRPALAKVISLRTAAVATVLVLSVGTAAAATSNRLPAPAQRIAHRAAAAVGIELPAPPPGGPTARLSAEQEAALDDCHAIEQPAGATEARKRIADLAAAAGLTGDDAVDRYCAQLREAVETGRPGPPATTLAPGPADRDEGPPAPGDGTGPDDRSGEPSTGTQPPSPTDPTDPAGSPTDGGGDGNPAATTPETTGSAPPGPQPGGSSPDETSSPGGTPAGGGGQSGPTQGGGGTGGSDVAPSSGGEPGLSGPG